MKIVILDRINDNILAEKVNEIEIEDNAEIIELKTKNTRIAILFNEKHEKEKFKQIKNVISEQNL